MYTLLFLLIGNNGLPADLGFLEGCWAGETASGRIEERYGGLHGGTLLGTVKLVDGEHLRFFEFMRIQADADGVWLQPWPRGKHDAPRFKLIELEPDKAVFENPAHDFPRRISYRLQLDGGLLTRVTGVVDGKEMLEEYVSLPQACRGPAP